MGKPVVYRAVSANDKSYFSKGTVDHFSISLTKPPTYKSGIFHLHTINFDDIEDLFNKHTKSENKLGTSLQTSPAK